MVRRLGFLLVVLGALALVPAASAAYPTPFAAQGRDAGMLSLDKSVRFVALKAGRNTRVSALDASRGVAVRSRVVAGGFGIPMLTYNGVTGGLFHDGRAFVLQSVGLHSPTRFAIVGAGDLAVRETIALKGFFGFDALSPDGSRLYLIQHSSSEDVQHYVVRAYDLKTHALVPGRIADKTQKSWVMQGQAVSRATTSDGRWVYTLYANPGGYPFVHALDTVNGVAHCVGLPWTATNQNPVYNFRLSLKGRWLAVTRPGGVWRAVDRTTWRVSK